MTEVEIANSSREKSYQITNEMLNEKFQLGEWLLCIELFEK